MSLKEGTVLSDKWLIGKEVGAGTCGIVYDVKPCNSNKKTYDYSLVVKIISLGKGLTKAKAKEQDRIANTLFYEYQLYVGHMYPFPYRPQLPDNFFASDDTIGVRYLVMEKLDIDLIKYSKSKPSVSDIAKIGLQLLEGLSWLHERGFVFVDVKPDNFMLKNDKVYFVDYGLAEMASKTRNQTRPLVGTPSYCSLSVHNSNVNVYKDDIESMALVLISLALECKLPWSNARSDNEVKTEMEKCDITALASSCGVIEMGEVVLMCRGLRQDQTPDYDLLRKKLIAMRDRKTAAAKPAAKPATKPAAKSAGTAKPAAIETEKKTSKRTESSKTAKEEKVEDIIEDKKVPLKRKKPSKNDDSEDPVLSSPPTQGRRLSGRGVSSAEKIVKKKLSFKVTAGPAKGVVFEQDSNTDDDYGSFKSRDIGRSGEFKKDTEISEQHIVFLWNWDDCGVLDLNVQDKGSSNGTKINGGKISKKTWCRLNHGDTVTIGASEIQVICA